MAKIIELVQILLISFQLQLFLGIPLLSLQCQKLHPTKIINCHSCLCNAYSHQLSVFHGKHLTDENTHYKGNYGNLLFLWDVIFGTAKITREYPKKVGVENLSEVSALTQLFWPIFRSPQEPKTEKV